MQRTNPISESCRYIEETRNALNTYLGKQIHIIPDDDGVISYPYDESGRLNSLQSLVGQYPMNENHPITLLDMLIERDKNLNTDNLALFILLFELIRQPLEHFPPIKKQLNDLIEFCIENLTNARIALGEKSELNFKVIDTKYKPELTLFSKPAETPAHIDTSPIVPKQFL